MRVQQLRIACTIVLTLLLLTSAGRAQSASYQLKVTIPFDFAINGVHFAAGEYLIVCTPAQGRLRDIQGHPMTPLRGKAAKVLRISAASKRRSEGPVNPAAGRLARAAIPCRRRVHRPHD